MLQEALECMDGLGFSAEERRSVFQLVAAVPGNQKNTTFFVATLQGVERFVVPSTDRCCCWVTCPSRILGCGLTNRTTGKCVKMVWLVNVEHFLFLKNMCTSNHACLPQEGSDGSLIGDGALADKICELLQVSRADFTRTFQHFGSSSAMSTQEKNPGCCSKLSWGRWWLSSDWNHVSSCLTFWGGHYPVNCSISNP